MLTDIVCLVDTAHTMAAQNLFLWDHWQYLEVTMAALIWEYDVVASEAVRRLQSTRGTHGDLYNQLDRLRPMLPPLDPIFFHPARTCGSCTTQL
jgi:hypothetical protein